jgi:amino acid transporter
MTTTESPATPPATQLEDLNAEGMARDVGLLGLLWASEGSIIGSGWLFGALTAATIAGPSAIIAWVIASGIVILLALVHAELGGLFAVTGGTSRFPHYAFGSFAGATFGWFAYIQAATVAPIEVLAAVEYLSSISWAKGLYNSGSGTLSGWGIVVAIVLMFLFVIANLIGVRWLARANTSITTWKVLVPVLTVVVLLITHFHGSNFSAGGGFFIHGAAFKSILIAIPTGGIVFSLLGFEQAVQLGGESANPKRDLPRAVIGSILIGAVIYITVQVAFIGALNPALLAHGNTWASLATSKSPMATQLQRAPFYAVASVAGLAWLAFILRIDAIISPGGTGLIYLTSASRISFGLAKNGYIPSAFSRTSSRKVPAFGVIITALLGLLFLLPFPSWDKLVSVVTGASVLMYAGAPLALGALRLQKPELARPYRLPWGNVLSPLAFILATFIVYWSGWQTYSTLMLVMVIGFILIAVSYHFNPDRPTIDWGAAIWVLPYLVGLGFISYFGGFGTGGIFGGQYGLATTVVGGNGDLPLYWDLLVLAVFSLGIYYVAIAKRLPTSKVDYYVREVYPQPLAV